MPRSVPRLSWGVLPKVQPNQRHLCFGICSLSVPCSVSYRANVPQPWGKNTSQSLTHQTPPFSFLAPSRQFLLHNVCAIDTWADFLSELCWPHKREKGLIFCCINWNNFIESSSTASFHSHNDKLPAVIRISPRRHCWGLSIVLKESWHYKEFE